MEKYERECPNCKKELIYSNLGNLNLAKKRNKLCMVCSKIGKKTKKNHPETIQNICTWCQEPFEVIWKKRKQKFCSKFCMYEWRKNETQKEWIEKSEVVKCLHCKKPFRRSKKGSKYRNNQKQIFCSNECNKTSDYKREKLRVWGKSDANPRKSQVVEDKIKQTKFERYGSETYNNPEQTLKTTLERHGVPYGYMKNPSNGKRISKGQRKLYNEVKIKYNDALLEHWLPDVKRHVDIFIPSKNKIIEYYGRYWHCDPNKYSSTYYNKSMKMTAKEVWERDVEREKQLREAGYELEIEWETKGLKPQKSKPSGIRIMAECEDKPKKYFTDEIYNEDIEIENKLITEYLEEMKSLYAAQNGPFEF